MSSRLQELARKNLNALRRWKPKELVENVADYSPLLNSVFPDNIREMVLILRVDGKDGLATQIENDWSKFATLIRFHLGRRLPSNTKEKYQLICWSCETEEARRHLTQSLVTLESMAKIDKESVNPKNLITTAVAAKNFSVSRVTLKRLINSGKLKSYRPKESKANSTHLVSAIELAALYPRK